MTRNKSLWCLLGAVVIPSLGLVTGCLPLTIPGWLEIIDESGNDVTGMEVTVASGEPFVFSVRGNIVSDRTIWQVKEGSHQRLVGRSYSNTFTNVTGSSVTYRVLVTGYCGPNKPIVEEDFWITVTSAGGHQHCDPDPCPEPECRRDSDCGAGKHCKDGDCVDDPLPPPDPTIDLKIDGQDGPLTVTANEDGGFSFKVFWMTSHTTRVDVSSNPATSLFVGERALTNEPGGEPVTLTVGTWVLKAVATGATGTTPDTDTVTLVIKASVPGSDDLCITSVEFEPPGLFCVGEQVTIIVKHTGHGTIHHLLATSTVVGSVTAEADGETHFTYRWPFAADGLSHFWPDDRDFSPFIKSVPVQVE